MDRENKQMRSARFNFALSARMLSDMRDVADADGLKLSEYVRGIIRDDIRARRRAQEDAGGTDGNQV